MDVPRQGVGRRKLLRFAAVAVVIASAALAAAWRLNRARPAAPAVDRAGLWIDTVRQAPLVRQVRGLGSLVPEEVLWIPAPHEGRVEKILLRPGAQVAPDTILVVLSNPELELAADDLRWQLRAAEANLKDLQVKLESSQLDLRSAVARVESEYVQAQLKADNDAALGREGLAPELNVKLSRAVADEARKRLEIERKRLEISAASAEAQIAAQRVLIEKLRAAYELKRKQVESLKVRAGASGVLQQLPVEVGQQVTPGTVLAKVAQPERLKAQVRIPEVQAKDLAVGQPAVVDTRNGTAAGRVARIDPAVTAGNVLVDIRFDGPLPPGARPDLNVEAVIEIERLASALQIQRPAFAQPNSRLALYRLSPDGAEAVRVQVRTGRASVQSIEILEGLRAGDKVILSDLSAYENADRLLIR
ncbi:MAG: HlyD family efflux transporter periplasmic adaptor subunit [Bryobacteraceae bacterium]|nr:HlyD family efflux transporter periplasmic adaptor subunit [Bryobacteraceae bacterium]